MNLYLKKTLVFLLAACVLLSVSCLLPAAYAEEVPETPTPDVVISKFLTQLAAGPVVLAGPERCVATTSTAGVSFSYGWYTTDGQPVTGNFTTGFYNLVMRFTAADGYVIAPNVAAYLNNSGRDLVVSVAADGKSATVSKRFEATIVRPQVIKSPGDEVIQEGSWVSYVATALYYTDLTWELTSPDGTITIDAERAIQQFPGVNLSNNHVDKINFYNVQASMDGWKLVAVFHGAENLESRSNATVLRVTPDPNKPQTPTEPEETPAVPEDMPTEPEDTPAVPEDTPTEPEDTPDTPTEPTPEEHVHDFSAAWSYDEQTHWHACSGCEEREGEAEHSFTWTETVKATRTSPGEEEGVCDVCGYTTTRATASKTSSKLVQRIPLQYPVYAILGLIVILIAAESIRTAVRRRRK